MEQLDLSKLSLIELIRLASSRGLLQSWSLQDGRVQITCGENVLELRDAFARTFIHGLILGHDLTRLEPGSSYPTVSRGRLVARARR